MAGTPSIVVTGGARLHGAVRVEGAKNSALKLMAAALLAPGVSRISNVPDIVDVGVMARVVEGLGASVRHEGHEVTVDATRLTSFEAPYELVAQMRASIIVLGPLVARLGHASVAMPGGCNIGSRKIDMHIRGLEELGVEFAMGHGYIHAEAPGGVHGAPVILDFPSVGATENLLMAAVLAQGRTTIDNAAREPEIGDLVDFLVGMGAHIEGRGTSTLVIEGVEQLHGVEHTTVGDRIEAGTFLVLGALSGGPIDVSGFDPTHMEMVLAKLEHAGCELDVREDGVTLTRTRPVRPTDVATLPYPGFPTDMQAQFTVLMSLAKGDSVVTENVFENRFMFADELHRMGADIVIEGHRALVRGVTQLSGAQVRCPDLRGGAALVLAGLSADGRTEIDDIYHIMRGYDSFVPKLKALGADIELV